MASAPLATATAEQAAATEEQYYDFFDAQTREGVIFNEDLSSLANLPQKELTDVEKRARKKWKKVRNKIESHYYRKGPPQMLNTDDLLDQRLLAPCLASKAASSRSKPAEARAGRKYPAQISQWQKFGDDLEQFRPTNRDLSGKLTMRVSDWPFQSSMGSGADSVTKRDERQEEIFLVDVLNKTLYSEKLVGKIVSSASVIGAPDIMTLEIITSEESEDDEVSDEDEEEEQQGDVQVVCEFKSTHNLPLAMSAAQVSATYNQAFQDVYVLRRGRTAGWSRTCDPIGQLLGYMADNSKRYGVLSSGTRSYFLRILRQVNGAEVVQISDAMFVGQPNYLKAWVYIHQLASKNTVDLETTKLGWKVTSKNAPSPRASGTRQLPSRATRNTPKESNPDRKRAKPSSADTTKRRAQDPATAVPSVPFCDIEIISKLGSGRNGTVFLANWKGHGQVALKQFDLDKAGGAYEQELNSYLLVQDAWGRLVPRPYFRSESWSGGVAFLALQLGRPPRAGDDNVSSQQQWRQVLLDLEEEFGLRHEDCDGRNMLFIPDVDSDDDDTGKERLVAIDLEDVTMLDQSLQIGAVPLS